METNKTNLRYCIYCGAENDSSGETCIKCGKPLYPTEHQVRSYLVNEFKDQLKSKAEDSIFERIRDFLLAHLFGLLLTVSVIFTGFSAFASAADDAVTIKSAPAADAYGVLLGEEEESGEVTPEPAPDYTHLVVDAFSQDVAFVSAGTDYTYSFIIPQIDLPSEEIQALNKEIYDHCYAYYEETDSQLKAVGYNVTTYLEIKCSGIDYDWYVSEGVLSLVVNRTMYPNSTERTERDRYMVDIEGQKQIFQTELLEKLGRTRESVETLAAEALGCNFTSTYKNLIESGNISESEALSLFRRTVDPENAKNLTLYLNSEGELCALGTVYTPAGAGKVVTSVNLDNHTVDDLYLKYIAMN